MRSPYGLSCPQTTHPFWVRARRPSGPLTLWAFASEHRCRASWQARTLCGISSKVSVGRITAFDLYMQVASICWRFRLRSPTCVMFIFGGRFGFVGSVPARAILSSHFASRGGEGEESGVRLVIRRASASRLCVQNASSIEPCGRERLSTLRGALRRGA